MAYPSTQPAFAPHRDFPPLSMIPRYAGSQPTIIGAAREHPKRVRITIKITIPEAEEVMRWLYDRDRRQVAVAAANGEDPLAVLHALQDGRIRYDRRDPLEHWKSRDELLEDGWGDCEDLATAVAAELNEVVYRPGFGGTFAGMAAPLPPPPTRNPQNLKLIWGPHGVNGDEAVPAIYSPRPNLFHVVTWTPTWGLLDPSVAGGMLRE